MDDDLQLSQLIADVGDEIGIEVQVASERKSFEKAFADGDFGTILLDLIMPDMDGIEYLRLLAERRCTARIGMISGYDKGVLMTARRYGQSQGLAMGDVLEKPFTNDQLKSFLSSLTRTDV
ncbi:MAG: response regulator [Rhodospirillales bacterium]